LKLYTKFFGAKYTKKISTISPLPEQLKRQSVGTVFEPLITKRNNMKQTIEIPWSVGDVCWSILERTVKQNVPCKTCNHISQKTNRTPEAKECVIDSIDVSISEGPSTKIDILWYHVAFDVGDKTFLNTSTGRWTYGTNVPNVWATREEAEAALAKQNSDE
jgi:hypothetical protein